MKKRWDIDDGKKDYNFSYGGFFSNWIILIKKKLRQQIIKQ